MSIQSLPASTIRIIGSSQVLTDPTSVVKELVDNALDAKASSIFVDISANSLDFIQVRDNGYGVAPEDRDLVCRRYCTSKIRDYSDLKSVGGKSLGFRGEALSSAAELSGTLSMTTRIDGEDVAVCLKIKTNGEVEGRDRASHPVGSTVRLTGLFDRIPVRKQTAMKQSAKSLTKTKRMLQSYALARPSVRFSLKILKAKNDKGNWTYAPKPGAGVEDAAFKVVGKECAGQCEWLVLEKNGYEVQAFLPIVTASSSKISNVGQFVSVDSRPVTTARGTMKQMMSLFKEKLRASNPSLANAKDVFIWLNIVCPPQSYDPNIEPAKDDVMFEDKDKVLSAVAALFDQCYPVPVARRGEPTVGGAIEIHEDPVEEEVEQLERESRQGHSNMYSGNDDEDYETLQHAEIATAIDVEAEERADSSCGLRDPNVSNPWVMAKMNASVRPRRTGSKRNGQLLTPLQQRDSSQLNSSSRTEAVEFPPHPPWNPPSPHSSSPLRKAAAIGVDAPTLDVASQPIHEYRTRNEEIDPIHDNTENEEQQTRSRQPQRRKWTGWSAINDFVPAAQLPLSTPSELQSPDPSPPFQSVRRQQYLRAASAAAALMNKPFVSPVHDESRVWFDKYPAMSSSSPPKQKASGKRKRREDHNLDIRDAFAGETQPLRRQQRARRDVVPGSDEDDDMEMGLDVAAFQNRRVVNKSTANPRVHDSAHPSLPLDFEPSSHVDTAHQPVLPNLPNDELDHRQMTHTTPPPPPPTRKPSRHASRTSRLPLERVPANTQLQNILVTVSTSISTLSELVEQLQMLEFECEDIRAPVWGWDGEDGDGGDGDGDGGGERGSADLDVNDGGGEEEVGKGARWGGRSSLVMPPPGNEEVGLWGEQLRSFVKEKGLLHFPLGEDGGLHVTGD